MSSLPGSLCFLRTAFQWTMSTSVPNWLKSAFQKSKVAFLLIPFLLQVTKTLYNFMVTVHRVVSNCHITHHFTNSRSSRAFSSCLTYHLLVEIMFVIFHFRNVPYNDDSPIEIDFPIMFEVALSLFLRGLECLGPLDSEFLCLSGLPYSRIGVFCWSW